MSGHIGLLSPDADLDSLCIPANRYLRIDGSMNANERSQNIDAFESSDKVRVFLLSVKATGLGITLTSASRVVIMDTGRVAGAE